MVIDQIDCIGTLKALEKDLENVVHKCDRYTEEAGEEMENLVIDGYNVSISNQCVTWRQMIFRRQSHLIGKEKADIAEEKRMQHQGDNLLRSCPLIKFSPMVWRSTYVGGQATSIMR